ncbi:hypothetical protein [Commensalibacter oyaizuii]|uniref:Uncharacterized protein n=1 Tax=Commensalibacter oyaizuii TaxID=3043873 RepID=A0ABT6PZB1_9PROT|nr:hypothetical protein [Commensalibacter sp. TBRC 16381]MDI2089846.1 hypothetical protein [Commensalibacter sp. TBRC 16381]
MISVRLIPRAWTRIWTSLAIGGVGRSLISKTSLPPTRLKTTVLAQHLPYKSMVGVS